MARPMQLASPRAVSESRPAAGGYHKRCLSCVLAEHVTDVAWPPPKKQRMPERESPKLSPLCVFLKKEETKEEPSRKTGGGGRSGVKCKGGGRSLQEFVQGSLGKSPRNSRQWPVGSAPCICRIWRARRASCVCFCRGPSNHQGRQGEGGDPG